MALNLRKALHLAAGFGTALALAGPLEVGATGADDGASASPDALVIDDFSSAPNATIGGRWSYTSDRVMGGVSNGGGAYETVDDRISIRLYGDVSTAQNGGFIQVSLRIDGRRINAKDYAGIEIDVLGNGEDYNVHVTTTRSFPPWRFYKHTFATTETWTRIRLPWSDFTSETFRQPLDPSTINRLNLTAYARDFEADLAVSRIALYR
jgi:hypothetical protein